MSLAEGLHIACGKYGTPDIDAVRELLKMEDINVNKKDVHGWTALHRSCASGNADIVKVLLSDERVKVNVADGWGSGPFFFACSNGHTKVVELMVHDPRVDINKGTSSGWSPLIVASHFGQLEVIQWLIESERELHIDSETTNGKTAIDFAKESNHPLVVQLLQDFKKDILKTRFEVRRSLGLGGIYFFIYLFIFLN